MMSQALWSYKLVFDFPTDAGILEYLRGRTLEVPPEGMGPPGEQLALHQGQAIFDR